MSQEIMKSNFILPKKNWWNLKLIFFRERKQYEDWSEFDNFSQIVNYENKSIKLTKEKLYRRRMEEIWRGKILGVFKKKGRS